MDKIKTNNIVDPNVQQPFKGTSLEFLQEGMKSMVNALAQSRVGEVTTGDKAYAMFGCRATLLSPFTFSYESGFIFDQVTGECYLFVGTASLTITDTAVIKLLETNDATADPSIFSDGSSHNVHKIRRCQIYDSTSGSGIVDYNNLVFVQTNNTIPAMVVAKAEGGTAESGTGTTATFKFATEISDAQAWHNTSNGKITPTIAGWYEINVKALVSIAAALSNFSIELYLYKNGSQYIALHNQFDYTGSNNVANCQGSIIAQANGSTDYFEVRMGLTSSQTWAMSGYITCKLLENQL